MAASATELLSAIECNQLLLHYQTIVNLQNSDTPISGFEALVRWHHPIKGLLYPGAFLPLVSVPKASDFIWQKPLFDWVFAEVCRVAAKVSSDRYIAINISPWQIVGDDFSTQIQLKLERLNLTGRVQFEIVEDLVSSRDLDALRLLLLPLSFVANIGIDDFGTGGSSLWRLSALGEIVSFIKIDRAFMPNSKHDRSGIAIYECMVKMAHILDLKVVAEGVEYDWQIDVCRSIGVDLAQGFYFGKGSVSIE